MQKTYLESGIECLRVRERANNNVSFDFSVRRSERSIAVMKISIVGKRDELVMEIELG